jgi:hypothetical protein
MTTHIAARAQQWESYLWASYLWVAIHGDGSIGICGSKLTGTRRHECRPTLDADPH